MHLEWQKIQNESFVLNSLVYESNVFIGKQI